MITIITNRIFSLKYTIIIIFILFNFSCKTKYNHKKDENLNSLKIDTLKYGILISSGTFCNNCFDSFDNVGIKYSKCIGKKKQTLYIETKDVRYVTDEDVFVGMKFNDAKIEETGFLFYFPLKSGWNAAFFLDENTDYQTMTKDSTVAFLFKIYSNY
jgi:hypothetical protein